MSKIYKKIIITITFLLLAGCSTKPIALDEGNIQILLAENWNIIENIPTDTKLRFPELQNTIFILNHKENVQIMATKTPLEKEITNNDFIKSMLQQAEQLPGYEKIKQSRVSYGGQKGYIHEFFAIDKRFMQSFVIKNDAIYIFSTTLEKDISAELQTEITRVLKTIKFN